MSRGRNGGAGGAKGARWATGAAPAASGRGKGRWSARRKMTVVFELLRGAELEAPSADGGADRQKASTQSRANVYGSHSSQEVLDRARKWALSFTANLPDFVCTQITSRSDNQGVSKTRR